MSASASLDLLHMLLKYASRLGIDSAKILQQIGLTETLLNEPGGRISFRRFNILWQYILEQSNDPVFGLHFGEAVPDFSSGHVLFAMMMNCASLKDALEQLCRYHGLLTDVAAPELSSVGQQIVFSGQFPGFLGRQYIEAVLAMLMIAVRRLTDNSVRAAEVHFVHEQPSNIAEHKRIFGGSLSFGQPRNSLRFNRQDLQASILMANPALLTTLEQFAKMTLGTRLSSDSWAQRSSEAIGKLIFYGTKPRLAAVAQLLAIGPRHLQNKLAQEGVSFQSLLDAARKQIALNSLEQGELSVCEIAFLLGFSEQSSFNHAFKRWTGETPSSYLQDKQLKTSKTEAS